MKVYAVMYDWYDTFSSGANSLDGVYADKKFAEYRVKEREKLWGYAYVHIDEIVVDESTEKDIPSKEKGLWE